MEVKGPLVVPPFRFATVAPGIFRSSYPRKLNFSFLQRLSLKTLITLTPCPPTEELCNFCSSNDIDNFHFEVAKFKDEVSFTSSQVTKILEIMISTNRLPVLVHCLDGTRVTGTIIMCFRKLQNWNLSIAITEYARYTRGEISRVPEFVESFRGPVTLPRELPSWLFQGRTITRHPTILIKAPESIPSFTEAEVKEEVPPPQTEITAESARAAIEDKSLREKPLSQTIQALSLEGLPTPPIF